MYRFSLNACKGTHFLRHSQIYSFICKLIWSFQNNMLPLHPLKAMEIRKVGRVIDRAGLEIRYTLFGYRGFESLTFRKRMGTITVPISLSLLLRFILCLQEQPFCHLVERHKPITLRGYRNGDIAVMPLFCLTTQRFFDSLLDRNIEKCLFGGFQ